MNFSWPPEYISYRQSVSDFASTTLAKGAFDRDQHQKFPADLWQKCADFGIQALSVTEEYGGPFPKVDLLRAMLAMEGLGYGCPDNGLAFGLNAQMWTVQVPINEFGSDAQKQKYLPAMVSGKIIGAHALTEPQSGSDVYSMQLTATANESGFLLNGKKHLITLAPACDVVLVFATTNPKLKQWGITAFLIDKNTPGFTISEKQNKMGMRAIPIGELNFDNCQLPAAALLGKVGMGFSILNHSLEYDRCCILASQLGAMQRQLEKTVDYAKSRQQFGQSIGKFQSVSNRIVDMKLRLETARLLLYKTAWLKQEGKNATMESALLKLYLSEAFVSSSLDAMRTFGGISYLSDHEVERDVRDAIGGILYAGTSDIQRNIVAKMMGL